MARIAKKKSIDNNAGLYKILGVKKEDVKSIADFGRFLVAILKDKAIFHTYTGLEIHCKAWALNLNGEAKDAILYLWLCNLIEMKKNTKGHENDIFPGTDVTYADILDSEIIMTEANLTHPLIAFTDMDLAAKFTQERLDYLRAKTEELDNLANSTVKEESEDDLKKNFEHDQQIIINEQVSEALNKEKEA